MRRLGKSFVAIGLSILMLVSNNSGMLHAQAEQAANEKEAQEENEQESSDESTSEVELSAEGTAQTLQEERGEVVEDAENQEVSDERTTINESTDEAQSTNEINNEATTEKETTEIATTDAIETETITEEETVLANASIALLSEENVERQFVDYCDDIFLSTSMRGEPVTDETVLALSDTVYIEYDYNFSELLEHNEIAVNDTFTFYIPQVLHVSIDESGYDYVERGETIAHVDIDTAATELGYPATMTILSTGTDTWDWSGRGDLWLTSTLNKDAVYGGLEEWESVNGEVSIDLGKGDPITVVIDAPVTPDLITEKAGELALTDRQAVWTVTVAPSNQEEVALHLYQAILTDTIEAGQTYVPGSLQISEDQENWTPVAEEYVTYENSVLQIDLARLIGQKDNAHIEENENNEEEAYILADGSLKYYLQYKTDVDCGVGDEFTYQLVQNQKITLHNTIQGSYEYKQNVTDTTYVTGSEEESATASATLDESSYFTKISDTTDTSKLNPNITWILKINQAGLNLENEVMITDTLPEGIDRIKDDTIHVTIDGTEQDSIVLHADDYQVNEEGRTYFAIDLAESLRNAITRPVKLTYETTIDWEGANIANGLSYTNDATFVAGGDAPWLTIHKSAIGTIADGVVLSKSSKGYNTSTHEFTWQIKACNYVNDSVLPDFAIYDVLPTGHDFVGATYTYTDYEGDPIVCDGEETEQGILLLKESNLGNEKREYIFTVTTKWSDEQIAQWTGNIIGNHKSINKALMIPANLTEESQLQEEYEVSASQNYTSTMLAKINKSYDYNTHIMTWNIVVNQNKLDLYNGVIVDEIPDGQEVVEESLQQLVNNHMIASYHITGQTVTLYLTEQGADQSFSEKRTLSIQTKLIDEDILHENHTTADKTEYELKNHAILQGQVKDATGNLMDMTDLAVDAKQKITTEILAKSGLKDKETDNFVTWTVDINKNQVKTEHMILDDTLPEGLTLDANSIQLVGLTISENGSKTEDSSITIPSYRVSQTDNVFTIEFTGKVEHAYRMTYVTFIDTAQQHVTVNNTIVLRGGDAHLQGDPSSNVEIYYTTMGGSTSSNTRPGSGTNADTETGTTDNNTNSNSSSSSNRSNNNGTGTSTTIIGEDGVPLAATIADEEVPLANIADEDVPLAAGLKDDNGLLPQTGGFWGSGIIYLLGVILVAAGMIMMYVAKKQNKKQTTEK